MRQILKWMIVGLVSIGFGAQTIGGYASDYLDYSVGARFLAMGGTGRSIAYDASSGQWNPASLPNVSDLSLTGMSTLLLGMTKYQQYALSMPLSTIDSVAFSFRSLGIENMELHGQNGSEPNANADGAFSTAKSAMMFSYGRKILGNVSLGFTAKYGHRSVYKSEDSVIAFDLGGWMELGTVQLGAVVRNGYSQIIGDTDDRYEMDVDMGANWRVDRFLFCLDFGRLLRQSPTCYVGAEYGMFPPKFGLDLKIRGGTNFALNGGGEVNEWTVGVGLQTTPLLFDYALLIRPNSQDHVFSLGLTFDDNAKKKENSLVENRYQEILAMVDEQDFVTVQQLALEARREYPDHQGLRHIAQNVSKVLGVLRNNFTREDEAHRLLRDACGFYLKQDWVRSLDAAEYLTFRYPKKRAYEFRTLIERDAKQVSKYKGRDMMEELARDAKNYEKSGHAERVIATLEKVLYYNPNQVEALKMMGKAYQLQKDSAKAIKAWTHAHEIEPSDEELRRLLGLVPIETVPTQSEQMPSESAVEQITANVATLEVMLEIVPTQSEQMPLESIVEQITANVATPEVMLEEVPTQSELEPVSSSVEDPLPGSPPAAPVEEPVAPSVQEVAPSVPMEVAPERQPSPLPVEVPDVPSVQEIVPNVVEEAH